MNLGGSTTPRTVGGSRTEHSPRGSITGSHVARTPGETIDLDDRDAVNELTWYIRDMLLSNGAGYLYRS